MKQILCFGDSNTYGLIPKAEGRYPWGIRWTSILDEKLKTGNCRVIEEGLCGRTTIFDDLLREGRRGTQMLPAILETHNPIDITVVMLGTNDCKSIYGATSELIGKGIRKIIEQKNDYDPEFSAASVSISKELAGVYKKVCESESIYFLDASSYAEPSRLDQEHLDEEGHRLLAEAVWKKISEIEENYVCIDI